MRRSSCAQSGVSRNRSNVTVANSATTRVVIEGSNAPCSKRPIAGGLISMAEARGRKARF